MASQGDDSNPSHSFNDRRVRRDSSEGRHPEWDHPREGEGGECPFEQGSRLQQAKPIPNAFQSCVDVLTGGRWSMRMDADEDMVLTRPTATGPEVNGIIGARSPCGLTVVLL